MKKSINFIAVFVFLLAFVVNISTNINGETFLIKRSQAQNSGTVTYVGFTLEQYSKMEEVEVGFPPKFVWKQTQYCRGGDNAMCTDSKGNTFIYQPGGGDTDTDTDTDTSSPT